MRDQAYKVEVSANVAQLRILDLVVVFSAKLENKCLISKSFSFIELFWLKHLFELLHRNRYVSINETPDLTQVSKG